MPSEVVGFWDIFLSSSYSDFKDEKHMSYREIQFLWKVCTKHGSCSSFRQFSCNCFNLCTVLEIPISSTKCISRFMWRDIYCICISRTSISWRSLGRFIFKITSFSLLSGSFSLVSRCEYSVHIVMCRYWQVFKYIWYYLFTCLVLSSISSKWVSSWEYLVCQCIDRPLADTTYLVEK